MRIINYWLYPFTKNNTFKVEVTNDNTEAYNLKYIEINFKDSSDKVSKLIGYIGEVIASGETREITASIDKDITDSVLKFDKSKFFKE